MNTKTPYPRRILLAVTGLSPQIITETVFALTQASEPPFIPTEIHIITTSEGAERCKLALLSDQPGWFNRLCTDYSLPPIAFDEAHIHVIHDSTGKPLQDIRSPEDNLQSANFITEKLRLLTADADSAVHVSIAGGRKTMGFLVGYALSLFGRSQDRLSHVLVSEPFEGTWDFFYPTPYSRVIETTGKKLADTRNATVSLADIPFVSLRHGLPQTLLDGRTSYQATVSAAQERLGPATLDIDLCARTVRAGGRTFTLPPSELALLTVFARRAHANQSPLPAPPKESPDQAWAARYLAEFRAIHGPMADIGTTERTLRDGMDGGYFSQCLSKLRRSLKTHLGVAALPYRIDDGGSRPRRYRLALDPQSIRIARQGKRASLR